MTKPKHSAAPVRVPFSALPDASGLYDPRFEHDACGVSFVVDVKGRASNDIVATALGALCNLDHRGASDIELDRKLFVARKRCEHEITNGVAHGESGGGSAVYFPSLSCRTLVYKGMLTTPQLPEFFL